MRQKLTFTNSRGESVDICYKPYILNNVSGLSEVESQDYTYNGYNQDGESYLSTVLKSRKIDIQFTIMADDVERLIKKRRVINQVFNPKLGIGQLLYSYKGSTRKLLCIPTGTPKIEVKSRKVYSKAQVTLTAYDPYFYDLSETKVNIATWRNSFKFPLTIPRQKRIIMGYKEPSLIVNVINEGDVECGLTIEFIAKGAVKNPSLLNVNTQEYIKVSHTMVAGEKIIVTTGYNNKKIVSELNGELINIMNYLDLNSTFLQLEVGDNLFRYDADENLSQLEVNIRYTQRYLGV